METSEEVIKEIERKSELYDAAKMQMITNIRDNFDKVMKKLKIVENKLLGMLDAELGENPYLRLLESIKSGNIHTNDEINNILSQEIPQELGPNEKTFYPLYRDIEVLESWQMKKEVKQAIPVLVQRNSVKIQYEIDFNKGVWMSCPNSIEEKRKYSVDESSPRIVTKIGDKYCTAIGNAPLPLNTVTTWNIKVLNSKENDGKGFFIGVAPFNINRNEDNYNKCGYYFYCHDSILRSGPPHNYKGKEYGPRKVSGEYVHVGDTVGVIMDTTCGDISFVVNNVNFGVAYEWVPLDKPLFPCAILLYGGDSVEFDPIFEVKETVDDFITVPSNITINNTTCDSISLTWNVVEGASFYQIEVDNKMLCDAPTTNSFTVTGLPPETEHTLRVRAIKENFVGKWSEVVKMRTLRVPTLSNVSIKSVAWDTVELSWDAIVSTSEEPIVYRAEMNDGSGDNFVEIYSGMETSFTKGGLLPETEYTFRVCGMCGNSVGEWSDTMKIKSQKWDCVWRECPEDIWRKYSLHKENTKIATNNEFICTIIGNSSLPLNKVISWNIKILNSKKNNGNCIHVGIAPFDIDQNGSDNCKKCGWYFYCYDSTLYSGPPHSYEDKEYGPRNEDGKYVHTGNTIGVVMNTIKGDLSFVVGGISLGVAFGGIPLDKPLVPCVILGLKDDSIEIETSEVKENDVDDSVPIPTNVMAKGIAWDKITLTWDDVEWSSFYQIEVDGSKFFDTSVNTFTKTRLLPGTTHNFRVRAVIGTSIGGWSDVVEGKTQNELFETSVWKKCPVYVDKKRRYSVDEKNNRIATKISDDFCCTVIGNAPLPPNKITSWSVKILKSKRNDGNDICIGVAPSDINQNEDNMFKCGWYLYCYESKLRSGLPHNYKGKEYGPRNDDGKYVNIKEPVGVVMDTINGELSFALNEVNLGVAYEGIPLDRPLVPCVVFQRKDDSIELVIQ